MFSSPLVNWILRGFQALFGIVVLGLAGTLIRGHHIGSLPSSLGFTAFVGGVTILAALVGLAATWVSLLEGIIGAAIDGLLALINIAGGIVLAIKLKGVKCKWDLYDTSNSQKLINNDLFNGGCTKIGGQKGCWAYSDDNINNADSVILGHCRESSAAMVFMFLTAALFIASGLMLFLRKRKGY